nr:RNA-directed DNA polymerase, eukaryota [Tanacetum cinerariifolium]
MNASRPAQQHHNVNHKIPPRPFKATTSFVSAVKGVLNSPISALPALVLDDSCIVSRDLGNYVMGEVKDFSSINNIHILLSKEGFSNVRIACLGGLWVSIELSNSNIKDKFLKHIGVASWFNSLISAQDDFVIHERIVWVDIEGIPLHAWTCNTFVKIGSKWGKVLDMEECKDDLFARKRMCIKTKQEDNILEKFKVIVKGKIYVIRAKELFTWSSNFTDVHEMENSSDEESVKDAGLNHMDSGSNGKLEEESDDDDVVSNTYNGDFSDKDGKPYESVNNQLEKEISNDPFKNYDILNKKSKEAEGSEHDASIPFPPGFTPVNELPKINDVQLQTDLDPSPGKSSSFSSRILECSQKLDEHRHSEANQNFMKNKEGSKAKKDWIRELNCKNRVSFASFQKTKMDKISHLDVNFLWGNSNFDFIFSEAVGNSGGILCVWDHNVFRKEHHTVSDNFVILIGTWIPNQKRIMIISVYAPHDAYYKRVLWSYLEDLVKRWNGECIIMGDFNEFRRIEERWGTNFNSKGAHVFNNFISNAGLVDIQLEGYSFTWAHPSGKKMSKLDRFLVSDGLLTLFPHMSVVCLERHLSDHRPILLREADEARESFQKAKIQWAVEGDETPNFFMELLIESAPIYVQSAFLPNRQILDGPFIINELLARCHHKKQSSMVFKVDFAKVYDSIRWDYLEDVLLSFGFGVK